MNRSSVSEVRRTTVAARCTSLDTLGAEARRRGVSLSTVMAEAIDEKAQALHASRRPRFGVASSTDGRSAAQTTGEPIAYPPS
jgi:hypothetical protein